METKPLFSRLTLAVLMALAILCLAPLVFGAESTEPSQEIYFTLAYVVGSLFAICYKMFIGTFKNVTTHRFRWPKLLWPSFISIILSVPLVFLVMPKFGRPTGRWLTDMIYAYLTTYALIDMTADLFEVKEIVQRLVKDASEDKPPG